MHAEAAAREMHEPMHVLGRNGSEFTGPDSIFRACLNLTVQFECLLGNNCVYSSLLYDTILQSSHLRKYSECRRYVTSFILIKVEPLQVISI